jgi:outer membrane receptor protein involved in Fe transport
MRWRRSISSVETLGTAVPNLVVQRSPFQPFVAIRGLGSGAGGRAFEQSVATYVDGIYAGRANQFLNPFFDVDRVEVVRGPQSVLFGVNANAGAINIVNKRPAAISKVMSAAATKRPIRAIISKAASRSAERTLAPAPHRQGEPRWRLRLQHRDCG